MLRVIDGSCDVLAIVAVGTQSNKNVTGEEKGEAGLQSLLAWLSRINWFLGPSALHHGRGGSRLDHKAGGPSAVFKVPC